MFTDIFSVNLPKPAQIGRYKVKHFAVKFNTLGSEVLLLTSAGKERRYLVCELPDNFRELVNSLRGAL